DPAARLPRRADPRVVENGNTVHEAAVPNNKKVGRERRHPEPGFHAETQRSAETQRRKRKDLVVSWSPVFSASLRIFASLRETLPPRTCPPRSTGLVRLASPGAGPSGE